VASSFVWAASLAVVMVALSASNVLTSLLHWSASVFAPCDSFAVFASSSAAKTFATSVS
jgi:hypothetical protein